MKKYVFMRKKHRNAALLSFDVYLRLVESHRIQMLAYIFTAQSYMKLELTARQTFNYAYFSHIFEFVLH